MDESDIIISSTEFIKDKLYFATLASPYRPESTKNSKYFQIEDEIVYESFYQDFGPYHLCHLYLFCTKLHAKLQRAHNKKVVFYTSDHSQLRLNAAYLIGGYAIIYLKKSPAWVMDQLSGCRWELLAFRDASAGPPLFEVSLSDVLHGLHRAHQAGFFNFASFNFYEYKYYEKVLNGDLNWIIPEKMLAFSGPHAQTQIKDGYPLHAPEHYFRYFRDNNVSTIVRLNKKSYSAKQFTDLGFDHYELFFIDGSAPSDSIVHRFVKICEESKGAVAVHCKAGLGRTGTLIACYMMKHFSFTARQAIAWLRICRPGSVIGHQQKFLENVQSRMLAEGAFYRRRNNVTAITKFKRGIYCDGQDAEDEENANVPETDLENVPLGCRPGKLDNTDNQSTPPKQNKADFVSLDSIINANVVPGAMETRSLNQQRVRANTALATAKSTYNSNKNNYIMSTSNAIKPTTIVKVQAGYVSKKMQTTTTNIVNSTVKSPTHVASKSTNVSPLKITTTKNVLSKSSGVHPARANLARNHGQTFSYNQSPLKTYSRKVPTTNAKLATCNQDNIIIDSSNSTSSITTLTESCSLNNKNYNPGMVALSPMRKGVNLNTNSLPTKLNDNSPRKKIVTRTSSLLRKKAQKNTDPNQDYRIDKLDNSDSERDSTNTTLTNISADSLENIPCKMATRRSKSKSPEPMDQCMDNVEEGVDSQGSKLYKIKATRKKMLGFASNPVKKEGVVTRSFSSSPSAKKK